MLKKLLLFVTVVFFMTACGGGTDSGDGGDSDSTQTSENEDSGSSECEAENAITFKTEKYNSGMDEIVTFDGPFEVKQAWFEDVTKEGADMKKYKIFVSNYDGPQDDSKPKEDGQMKIEVYILAKNGKEIEPASFPYGGNEDLTSGCHIKTNKGKIYFNWALGEPKQGDIKIDALSDDALCATFGYKVEQPDDERKGVVVLNGTFKAEKK